MSVESWISVVVFEKYGTSETQTVKEDKITNYIMLFRPFRR